MNHREFMAGIPLLNSITQVATEEMDKEFVNNLLLPSQPQLDFINNIGHRQSPTQFKIELKQRCIYTLRMIISTKIIPLLQNHMTEWTFIRLIMAEFRKYVKVSQFLHACLDPLIDTQIYSGDFILISLEIFDDLVFRPFTGKCISAVLDAINMQRYDPEIHPTKELLTRLNRITECMPVSSTEFEEKLIDELRDDATSSQYRGYEYRLLDTILPEQILMELTMLNK